jgi:hypothetical protein
MKAEAAHAHGHPLTVAAVVGSFSVFRLQMSRSGGRDEGPRTE